MQIVTDVHSKGAADPEKRTSCARGSVQRERGLQADNAESRRRRHQQTGRQLSKRCYWCTESAPPKLRDACNRLHATVPCTRWITGSKLLHAPPGVIYFTTVLLAPRTPTPPPPQHQPQADGSFSTTASATGIPVHPY